MTLSSLHPRRRRRALLPVMTPAPWPPPPRPPALWPLAILRAGSSAGRRLTTRAGSVAGAILLASLFAVSLGMPAASADSGIALVSGRAAARQFRVVRTAVEEELRKAGWSLPTIGSAEKAALATCFLAAHPWPCLATVEPARRLQRMLAIQVEPDPESGGQPQLRLTGRLLATEGQQTSIDSRYCGPCSDAQLAAAASKLAQRLLIAAAVRKETTLIEVRTQPPGATILLDGRMVEATDHTLATNPGSHSVHLQLSGHHAELRTVQAREGDRLLVDVTLRPHVRGRGSQPTARLEVVGRKSDAGRSSTSSAGTSFAATSSAATSSAATSSAATRSAAARAGEADLLAAEQRAEQRYDELHRRRRLGWALTLAGGALIATGVVLFALDEDAEPDPTRRHEPLYFDSAPAGVILMALGGAFSTTGVLFVRLSPPPPAPTTSSLHLSGAILGYSSQF